RVIANPRTDPRPSWDQGQQYTLTSRPPAAREWRLHGPGDLRSPRSAGGAARRALREPAAAAGEIRRRRLLLVPSGRAPRHAAGAGAGARHLPRRGHPAYPPHPPRALRVLPAALRPAPTDRRDLHARPALARALRLRRGPRDRALRDGLLQPASPRDRGDLPRGARGHPAGADERSARP